MQTVRPATVRGPVSGSNVRVIWDDTTVAVVSATGTVYLTRTEDPATLSQGGKYEIGTTDGTLIVVRQGGCSCGKPWLSTPSSSQVMAAAPQPADA